MPMLNVYVSDETLAQLTFHTINDEQGRDALTLAEDCVADAAIRGLPANWREAAAKAMAEAKPPQ